MHRLLYIVLLGGLVLTSVSEEVDSARESLERSTFDDQSLTDNNENVNHTQNLATIESSLRSPVNVRSLETGRVKLPPIDSGGQASNVLGRKMESRNSEERHDLSSERNPLQFQAPMVSLVNRNGTAGSAEQVVNKTASSGDIPARARSGDQGQRIIATNRSLQNRLSRGSTTTTTADSISGHSDENNDDSDTKTTTARSLPPRNRISGFRTTTAQSSTPTIKESGERDEPVTKIETTTIRNSISGNGLARFRTTIAPAAVNNSSDEETGLTKQTVTTTARSAAFSNRLSRVRTTTVPISDASVEEVESVSVVPATPTRTSVFGNQFGRFRTTTLVSRDSDENVDTVKEIQTTTIRNPVSTNRLNRFQTTTSPKPVIQESDEQMDVLTTTTQSLPKSLAANRFNRIRTTTAATPISDTSVEVDDSAVVTQSTTSRTLILASRFSRFRTTTSAPVAKKDSKEQDETVNTTTTTTTRTSPFRSRFNPTRTTASPTISRDSIEEEDVAKKTSTTTARNLPPRNRFGLTRTTTVPGLISANSDEDVDVVNKTETTTTRRFLAENRFAILRTTVPPPVTTTSQNSDEVVDSANANQTTTTASSVSGNRFKSSRVTSRAPVSKDSEEQIGSVKKTQTTIRNSLLRNRFSRPQTTTTGIPSGNNSDDKFDSNNRTQTTSSNTSSHIEMPASISSDLNERVDKNNGTETTTIRTRVTLKYFNRYRTTTPRKGTLENSDEQVDHSFSTTEMTSNLQIPFTTGRPPLTATSSLEIANLGRKDRAIIYNSKTNVGINHLNDFQTQAPPPASTYFTAVHSDETDDVSEDEDISSNLYPYVQYRTTTVVPFATLLDEENSVEVDDFSAESNDTITGQPENSAEISKDDLITVMAPDAAGIFTGKKSADHSMEVIFFVSNNSESVRNQAATLLQNAKLFIDSDEGNDVSAEGEGSSTVPDDDFQYQTTAVHQYAGILGSEEGNDASTETQITSNITNQDVQTSNDSVEQGIYESEERSNTSTDSKVSNRVLTEDVNVKNQTESDEEDVTTVSETDGGNTVSAENGVNKGDIRDGRNQTSAEVFQDSDENDESSLEVDVSKLPEIKKLLTDAENEGAAVDLNDGTAAVSSENHASFPDIDSLMKVDVDHQPTAPAVKINETLMEDANKKNEVNMKIRELLTNPIVQERLHERLQAIDGRLKDSKSARVKRLIEKYLAALAKLSPSSNSSASTSFSVFFPLIITCLLFGFS